MAGSTEDGKPTVDIRSGRREDMERVHQAIRSLADHIGAPDHVLSTPDDLTRHAFGDEPVLFVEIAEIDGAFAEIIRIPAAAIRAGFAIALPLGTGRLPTWNGGYCCGAAARTGVDDIAFLDRVARDASLRAGTTGKIFVTGMSNGAIMAQTWAAARPATIAAVVSVAGTMDADRVRVRGPVPILHIHGTADEVTPIAESERLVASAPAIALVA